MGLRFSQDVNITHSIDILIQAADANPEKFDVFTRETMPERYHFSNNERIAPIYVIPKIGYALTNHKEGDVGMTKGVSILLLLFFFAMLTDITQEPRI